MHILQLLKVRPCSDQSAKKYKTLKKHISISVHARCINQHQTKLDIEGKEGVSTKTLNEIRAVRLSMDRNVKVTRRRFIC